MVNTLDVGCNRLSHGVLYHIFDYHYVVFCAATRTSVTQRAGTCPSRNVQPLVRHATADTRTTVTRDSPTLYVTEARVTAQSNHFVDVVDLGLVAMAFHVSSKFLELTVDSDPP